MAADQTISKVLSLIAANYGKRDSWAGDVFPVWKDGLQHMPDRLLFDAAKRWMAEHQRTPTIANIRNTAKGMKPDVGALKPQGCRRCDQTGWVEVAHHVGSPNGSESRVNTYTAACDCAAGYRLQNGSTMAWEPFCERLKADPYTIQLYHSTPERPHLTKWERMTPAQLERLEIARAAAPKLGSWHKLKPKV
jgi:hypothetical protein